MLRYRLRGDPVESLKKRGESVVLRGGARLYSAGDEADAVYHVVSGRLRVLSGAAGSPETVREVGPGEWLGAVSVFMGRPRSAGVVAIRDTRLLKIDAEAFAAAMRRAPEELWAFGRMCLENVVQRQQLAKARRRRTNLRTVAVIPAEPDLPVQAFGTALATALEAQGPVQRLDAEAVDAALGAGAAATPVTREAEHLRLIDWLTGCEREHQYVIYQADRPDDEPWTRRCLRQADRILVLARPDRPPQTPAALQVLERDQIPADTEMVFLPAADAKAHLTPWTWRERCRANFHHWVDLAEPRSCARLARLLTGQALCLVLGGGGARGAAHLGLLYELEARGLEPDMVAGTSIGALIGGMVAQGWSADTIREKLQHLFIDNNFLNDYAVPRVALINGRRMRRALESVFGDSRIELLSRPFFCLSTNLTRGESMIHNRGPIVHWLVASSSVPGVAPPVAFHGDLLVDGAVLNNLPANIMQEYGRGEVIASDVTAPENLQIPGTEVGDREPAPLPRRGRDTNLFKIMFRSATLLSPEQREARRAASDLYLAMPVGPVGMFDWSRTDQLIDEARAYAGREIDQWLEARNREPSSSSSA